MTTPDEHHRGTDIQTRMNYLLSRLCLADRPSVSKAVLLKEVNSFFEHNIGAHALSATLIKIRDSGIPGFTLTIGKEDVTLKRRDTIILRERQRKHLELKRNIGIVLWEVLLNIKIDKESELKEERNFEEAFARKLESLHERTHIVFLVDAGSSTSSAIEQLLTAKSMPIETTDGRLVRPTFITNSLEIADVVSRSDYPREIPVRIIGGELRVEYGSICGPLADICLSGWGGMGADVAIVGATSCTAKAGIPSFGCDDISEGRVKVQMLESAALRIVIFDSSKLAKDADKPSRPFAQLSDRLIDLIVTDDGKATGQESRVEELKRIARNEGVSLVVMNSD